MKLNEKKINDFFKIINEKKIKKESPRKVKNGEKIAQLI